MTFILNGGLFLLGAITLINDNKILLALIQLVAAVLNSVMILGFINKTSKQKLNYAVLVMNVIVCLSVALDAILSHRKYLQYAWFIAAVVSIIALIIQIKKNQKLTDQTSI